jgi:hypothetical protein
MPLFSMPLNLKNKRENILSFVYIKNLIHLIQIRILNTDPDPGYKLNEDQVETLV